MCVQKFTSASNTLRSGANGDDVVSTTCVTVLSSSLLLKLFVFELLFAYVLAIFLVVDAGICYALVHGRADFFYYNKATADRCASTSLLVAKAETQFS